MKVQTKRYSRGMKYVICCHDCKKRLAIKTRGRSFDNLLILLCDNCYLEKHLNA